MHCIDEDNDELKGMRIKKTTWHSAAGQSASLLMTVNGLDESELIMTEEEFEKHKGTFVVRIQGLTVNGENKPMDQGNVCIVFMWSTKHKNYSADEAIFFWHKQEILMNFINGIRAMLCPEFNDGVPIETHVVSTSWQDR